MAKWTGISECFQIALNGFKWRALFFKLSIQPTAPATSSINQTFRALRLQIVIYESYDCNLEFTQNAFQSLQFLSVKINFLVAIACDPGVRKPFG